MELFSLLLKHTTTLFYLFDHYILSREWRVASYRPIIMICLCCYNQSGVTELLVMWDPHYGRICFKSVKTLRALHSQLWKRHRSSASAFSAAKSV